MANVQFNILIAFSLIAIIYAGPIPIEFQDVAPEIRETCLKESGVKLELIEQAANGNFIQDQALKCYIKCVYHQFRLISEKGFNFKALSTLVPPRFKKPMAGAMKKCNNTTFTPGKENDLCDLSYNIHACFYHAIPDIYFLI